MNLAVIHLQHKFKEKMRNLFLATVLVLGCSIVAIAGGAKNNTNSTITGKVIDSNKEAVVGALISIEGVEEKVYTDLEGNFTINTPKANAIIVSFISFEDEKVQILETTKELTVVLEEK